MTSLSLDTAQRRSLRAAAHPLRVVVQVGDKGLTPAVLAEIDRALLAHGLIKVRVASDDRNHREALLQEACTALSAAPVHHLGKVLILYRPRDSEAENLSFRVPGKAKPITTTKTPADAPYVPKKLAAEGKTEPLPRRRIAKPVAKPTGILSPRERYLGSGERAPRPTTRRAAPSRGNSAAGKSQRGSAFSLSARRRKP